LSRELRMMRRKSKRLWRGRSDCSWLLSENSIETLGRWTLRQPNAKQLQENQESQERKQRSSWKKWLKPLKGKNNFKFNNGPKD